MLSLTVFPSHFVKGLTPENMPELIASGDVASCGAPMPEALEHPYESDAGFVQYALLHKGEQLRTCARLKRGGWSLMKEAEIDVVMPVLALDLDRRKGDGGKSPWGSPADFDAWYTHATSTHPILSKAFAYSTPHGARFVFSLQAPFAVDSDAAARAWRGAYIKVCDSFGDVGPAGERFEAKAAWTEFFRPPRTVYSTDGVSFRTFESASVACASALPVTWSELGVAGFAGAVAIEHRAVSNGPPVVASKVIAFPSQAIPENSTVSAFNASDEFAKERLESLESEPLFKWSIENPRLVAYNLWRGIGTNIYALCPHLPDHGRRKFHDWSGLDSDRYCEATSDLLWATIIESANEGYGPVTYREMRRHLSEDVYDAIYRDSVGTLPPPSSSIAGQQHRVAREASARATGRNTKEPSDVLRLLVPKLDSKGNPVGVSTAALHNLRTILRSDVRFKDAFERDLLGPVDMVYGRELTDTAIMRSRYYISETYKACWGKVDVGDGLRVECEENQQHPVQTYLLNLRWDGVDRVDELVRLMNVPLTDYSRLIIRRWLTSAVVRPLQLKTTRNPRPPTPNMKVDTMLVLKGAQGVKKSTFFQSLAPVPEWFSDTLPSIQKAEKDAHLHMLRYWIIECGEVDELIRKTDFEHFKRFVSWQREDCRMPYDKAVMKFYRPSILVGSTNSTFFLNDPTGSRRFWVLAVNGGIDTDRVKKIRDQLWAQAVHQYESGGRWWLDEAEDELRASHNAAFQRPDAMEEYIGEWLARSQRLYTDGSGTEHEGGFTLIDCLQGALSKGPGAASSWEMQQCGSVLARLGFQKVRKMVDGKSNNIYIR